MSESKLDVTILQSEIQLSNYQLFRCNENGNGGGVASYVRIDVGDLQKTFFPKTIENIFVEILLPKTKPLIVEITYRPPNQNSFLEIINSNFDNPDTDMKELHILADFNINMCVNNKYIVGDILYISSNSSDIRNYHQLFAIHDLKQLIKSRARVNKIPDPCKSYQCNSN